MTEVVQAELKAVGIAAEITNFDSSTIRDQYKTGDQQLAVRSYWWGNADIVDWFFGGDRLGYPNVSMFNDPKAEELRVKAMSGSVTQADRIANFTRLSRICPVAVRDGADLSAGPAHQLQQGPLDDARDHPRTAHHRPDDPVDGRHRVI